MIRHDSEQSLPSRIRETLARQVLDRAMELDHEHGPHMTLDNVRSIASELGISDESLQLALVETLRGAEAESVAPNPPGIWSRFSRALSRLTERVHSRWRGRIRLAAALALPFGASVGALLAASGQVRVFAPVTVLLWGVSALLPVLFLVFRPRGMRVGLPIGTGALYWVGWGLGVVLVAGRYYPAIGRVSVMLALLTTAVGLTVWQLFRGLRRSANGAQGYPA
jgi:hypothetical protein